MMPDILLTPNGDDEWFIYPVTARARDWTKEHVPNAVYQDRSIVVRGFHYVVEIFDSLTDDGLPVR